MTSTRRQFLLGISTLALAAALTPAASLNDVAFAQTIPNAELMKAGPLGERVMGAADAPITMIEYASLTCSHCADFAAETFPQIKQKYIDAGKIRYIFREFPFDNLAAAGFMLARCAPEEKYFSFIDLMFHTQRQWAVENPLGPLLNIAKQAGFTEDTFKSCLANQQVLDGISWVRDRAAKEFKVDSTPTFFINGQPYKGALPFAEIDKILQGYLKS